MNRRFHLDYPLRYQDTDGCLRATPVSLLGAMQEAAILHSEHVQRGIAWLTQRNLSWVLAQTRTKFLSIPSWKTKLGVTTWVSEMGKYLSRREFQLADAGQNICVLASTLWAFVDIQARRVTRIPPDILEAYSVLKEFSLEGPFQRPQRGDQPCCCKEFVVRRFESDFNGHVNNLRYLDWILETIPEQVLHDFNLSELSIRFQKEVLPGSAVGIQTAQLPNSADSNLLHFAHEILLRGSGASLALADSVWTRANETPHFGN